MTHAEFTDYPRNGDGLTVYAPSQSTQSTYPVGTELIFHIDSAAAYLDHSDLIRLRATIEAHLEHGHFDHDNVGP